MKIPSILATVFLAVTRLVSAAEIEAVFTSATSVPVTAASYAAAGNTVNLSLNFAPPTGTNLTVVNNTGLGFISDTFGNLAQGQKVELPYGGITYEFVANYYGGSGNDLVLVWANNRAFAWGVNTYGQLGDNTTEPDFMPGEINAAEGVSALYGKTVMAMATGSSHSLALGSDGTVATWGSNTNGQLGDGSTTNRSVPVAVTTTAGVSALSGKTVVAVAAGGSHNLALCSDGTVAAWGRNDYGQLGTNTTTDAPVPVAVNTVAGASALSGKTVVAVAAGESHSLALCSDGTVAAWGNNLSGQLGYNTGAIQSVPVAVSKTSGVSALAGKTVVAIAAGESHCLALCTDGTLTAWGSNLFGQLGDNTANPARSEPAVVNRTAGVSALYGKTVVAVAAGSAHSLALCSDGTVTAWGYNSWCQLGDGTTASSSVPVSVNTAAGTSALSGKTVVAVAAGYWHSLAICSDGTAVAWGSNSSGRLGNNNFSDSPVPVAINTTPLRSGERFSRLTCGSNASHSLALVAVPYAPEFGLTGNGAAISSGSAAPIIGNHTDFGSRTVGGETVTRTFTIQNMGNLPLNLTGTPKVVVTGLHAADFTVTSQPGSPVAAGGSTTFQVAFTPGAAWSRFATLRIASDDPDENPYEFSIRGGGIGVLDATFGAGGDVPLTTGGFTATGSLVNLSLNFAPLTGTALTVVKNMGPGFINGTFDNLAQGQQVALSYGGVSYEFVADYHGGSGNDLVLAWANNRVIAWGSNSSGQLGDNTTTNRRVPVAVNAAAEVSMLSGKMVVAVAVGGSHSLALCSDGSVAAWGSNNYGQLGDGTTTNRLAPVAVNTGAGVSALAGKTVVAVAAGQSHSLALCSDGTIAAWGSNSSGQLGDTTTINRSVPVDVNAVAGISALAGKTVEAIAVGLAHNLAICSDGTVAAWGYNAGGQLGDNTAANRSVPVQVSTTAGVSALAGKTVVALAGGYRQSLALCSDGTLAAWGDNWHGPLGTNTTNSAFVPAAVNTAAGVSALSGKTVVAVAAGHSHSLALCSDGSVAAWGYNSSGQLGNASTFERFAPVAVNTGAGVSALSGKTAMAVSAGASHSLALCSDGALTAWGSNYLGRLGDNTTIDSSVPVFANASSLAFGERCTRVISGSGASHTLALVAVPYAPDITLSGNGASISDGSTTPSAANHTDFGSTPMGGGTITRTFTILNTGNVPLSLTGTPKVVVSGIHAADFTVTSQPESSVAVGGSTTFQVAFSPSAAWLRTASLSIASDDPDENPFEFVICGTPTGALDATFATCDEVPLTSNGFTAAGRTVNLSLAHAPDTGAVLTVVRNTGPLAIEGTFDNLSQGQKVGMPYGGITYEFVANYYGGSGNDLVLVWANNRVFAWGNNAFGQLGDTTTKAHSLPLAVNSTAGVSALAGKTVLSIATGSSHSLALCSDGAVAAWGYNYYGQLGDNTTTDRSVPVAVDTTAGVSALSGKTVVAVAGGHRHSLALCSDGTVISWGRGVKAPFAVDTTAGVSAIFGKTVVSIAAGLEHSLALCSDGTVAAWGYNDHGQLGDNTTFDSSVPVAVNTTAGVSALAGKKVVAVAAGYDFSLAVCTDGTVAAWGNNGYSQLGDGTATDRLVPVAVNTAVGQSALAGKTVVNVAAGYSHSLALCTDGTVAAWGYNSSGQLGDNTTTSRPAPVAVNTTAGVSALSGKTVVAVAAADYHSLAFCSDGTATAWGTNTYGQLGNGTWTDRLAPVAVTTQALTVGERLIRTMSGASAVHALGLAAVPYLPDISLTGNGESIPDGSTLPGVANHTDFGSTAMGGSTITRTFTIQNNGNIPLYLTGTPKVTVGGPHAADFMVTGQPDSPVAAGGSTTFQVTFTPSAAWLRAATLSIASDDPDENPYDFAIQGNATGVLNATIAARGDVPLTGSGFVAAGSSVNLTLAHSPATGTDLMVVRNTGTGFINGTFDNLAQGQRVALIHDGGTYEFVANYYGGSGNDLVLVWANQRTFAWGSNSSGKLGDNTGVDRAVPVLVNTATGISALSGKTVVAAAAGSYHSLALCSDGTVAACGYNYDGQLGDNTTTNRLAPVAVNTAAGVSALAGKSVVAVAIGANHSLALCSDGTVAAWGNNYRGQLGDNTTANRSVPVAVNTTAGVSALAGKTVVAVAAGSSYSLALCSDGTVAAWGFNYYGQLGDNTGVDRSVPVAVNTTSGLSALAGKSVLAVAAGGSHSLALCSDGTVVAWGSNSAGQIGDSSLVDRIAPVAVNMTPGVSALSGKTVVAVTAGGSHNLALCADGTLAAWGSNYYGQIGDNSWTSRSVPVAVNKVAGVSALAGKTLVEMCTGSGHSMARCSDGTVALWGYNAYGQIGDTTTTNRAVPVAVSTAPLAAGEQFTRIMCGSTANHSFAFVAVPYTPEMNLSGNGTAIPDGSVTPIGADHTDFGITAVGGGTVTRTFTIHNTGNQTLKLTGNPKVLLGGPHTVDFTVTSQPESSVAAGGSTTFQIAFNPTGEWLRRATVSIASNDVDENPYDFAIQGNRAVALDASFAAVGGVPLTTNGLIATGSTVNLSLNFIPATGTNLTVVNNTGPGFITGTFDNLAQGQKVELPYGGITYEFVANYYGGSGNDLVLVWANQRTFAWGGNSAGQLGDNGVPNRSVPVAVNSAIGVSALAGKIVVSVATGTYHSLALCSDGTVAAWGYNYYGQLGDNTTTHRYVPVAVNTTPGVSALAGKTVVAVAAGGSHSLALCSDGTVAAWGSNTAGQLGNNTTADFYVPVAVTTAAGFSALAGKMAVAVAAGERHSLALCADGTVVAWGYNGSGRLGDNTTTSRSVPVAVNRAAGISVLSGKTVVAVTAGGSHSMALCSDGTVAAWGNNSYGQLGDNTSTNRSVPVATNAAAGISALSNSMVIGVAAGGSHSLALCADGTVAAWGFNSNGQLGDGTTTNRTVPVPVSIAAGVSALAEKTVAAVAVGLSHSLALCADGTVATWGYNSNGQLGDGTTTNRSVPVAVNAAPLAFGERFTRLMGGSNGSHTLALVAAPYAPEMKLTGNGASIPVGATTPSLANHTDFGTTTMGGGGLTRTFTIQNTGNVPLNLTGAPKVVVSGAHATDFTVTSQPESPIAAGGSTTFQITFVPSAVWMRTATVSIPSDDPHERPFEFAILGTCPGTLNARFASGTDVPLTTESITLSGSSVNLSLAHAPVTGAELTVIRNTGPGFINGTFDNLAQGQRVMLPYGGINYEFIADYFGGGGNDLVLVWPNTRVFSWGNNSYGQLGKNSVGYRPLAVAVDRTAGVSALAGKTVVAVSAGGSHSLALCSDGTVVAWGSNSYGQLGDNTTTNRSVPVAVNTAIGVSALAGKTVVAVAAGGTFSLALCSDGIVVAWGYNYRGQLGDGSITNRSVPTAVNTATGGSALAGKTVVAVAAGGAHSLALCTDGTVAAWGANGRGQLGTGGYTDGLLPLAVSKSSGSSALAGKTVVSVAAGQTHSLARCSDGTVAAWGSNSAGELGNNSTIDRFAPVAVNAVSGVSAIFGKTVVALAAGGNFSLALCSDGIVVAWGYNHPGQLGDGSITNRSVPTAVNTTTGGSALAGKTVVAVEAGSTHSLARCSDGTVAAWGFNGQGQLGNNSVTDWSVPVAVTVTGDSVLSGRTVTALKAGGSHSLALCSDGSLASWGSNYSNQLGDNTLPYETKPSPVNSVQGVSALSEKTVVAGATGGYHGLARCADGSVISWGLNSYGQLGDGTTTSRSVPVAVSMSQGTSALSGKTVVSLAAGEGHSLALCSDGFAVGWGNNSSGQLGDNTTTNRSNPVAVNTTAGTSALSGKSVVAVAAGGSHSLALCTDGKVVAWGDNLYGKLGDGTTMSRSVPVEVNTAEGVSALSGKMVVAVAAGDSHNLALCSDGTLVAWGYNFYGQLGDNTTANRSVPVAVNTEAGVSALSGKTVVSVAAGESHSLALCSDGTIVTWGLNNYGQIGDNTTTNRSVPVAVSTNAGVSALAGKSVVSVIAGGSHSMALCSDGTAVAWGSNTYGQIGDDTITYRPVPVAIQTGSLGFGERITLLMGGSKASHSLALVAAPLPALPNWRFANFGNGADSGDGADLNDFDHDGLSNIMEFALGLDPKQDSSGLIPAPQRIGGNLSISFAQPEGVGGITYGAEWSETLLPGSWTTIPDTGNTGVSPALHHFSVPVGNKGQLFIRLKVTAP
ncbi:MAG: choice-of-anchor D domain-containing protein [Verrucomicrobia bacterium]|nr:choice-of-anchor D domain-containing protein [Verrucomicrobiota bacterium]